MFAKSLYQLISPYMEQASKAVDDFSHQTVEAWREIMYPADPAILNKTFEFKGYKGKIVNYQNGVYWGELIDVDKDVITFSGKGLPELNFEFKSSVMDYLDFKSREKKDGAENN